MPWDSKRGKVRVGTENLASATGLLWTTVTLSSLTCEEGGNLLTQDLSFIYVSSEGRVGCEFLHPAQPTEEEALGPISIPQGSHGVGPF